MKRLSPALLFIFFANVLLGQIGLQVQASILNAPSEIKVDNEKQDLGIFFSKENNAQVPTDLKYYFLADRSSLNFSNSGFQKNGSKTDLAFFCKIEAEIEGKSKIPVRFRLGEVQAVDNKEGKWQQFNQ